MQRTTRTILTLLSLLVAVAAIFALTTGSAQDEAVPDPAGIEAGTGLTTLRSAHTFEGTISRLSAALADAGLVKLATVDHAANATDAGLELPPTTLFLFGNPEAGTPLMRRSRGVAIDLPQKMLVWEDADGVVYVTWNAPAYLAARHGLDPAEAPLPGIDELLKFLAESATTGE